MPTITYRAQGFPAGLPLLQGRQLLNTTWPEIVWAAITVGRRNYADLIQHGVREGRARVRAIDDVDADELVGEARQQMNRYAEQFVEAMAREPRQQLQEAVDNMLTSLREGRRIVPGTIAQIERAVELLRGFRFLADSELLRQMDRMEAQLQAVTVAQLNSDTEIGSRLAAVLQPVSAQAANILAVESSVRNFRRINVNRGRERQTPTAPATSGETSDEPAMALV